MRGEVGPYIGSTVDLLFSLVELSTMPFWIFSPASPSGAGNRSRWRPWMTTAAYRSRSSHSGSNKLVYPPDVWNLTSSSRWRERKGSRCWSAATAQDCRQPLPPSSSTLVTSSRWLKAKNNLPAYAKTKAPCCSAVWLLKLRPKCFCPRWRGWYRSYVLKV
jgi:hypothetical protein